MENIFREIIFNHSMGEIIVLGLSFNLIKLYQIQIQILTFLPSNSYFNVIKLSFRKNKIKRKLQTL